MTAPVPASPPPPPRHRRWTAVALVAAAAAVLVGAVLDGHAGTVLRNLGSGLLGGFVVAKLLRALFVPTVVAVGLAVAAAWWLAGSGVLPEHVHPRELVLAGAAWLGHETLMLERLALHVLPVAASAALGMLTGLRR